MSTLPFQVEELIATLNSTSIGTEALELAKLQAQLRQALQAYPQGAPYPTSPVQYAYTHGVSVPTNTPTARTHVDASHGRRRRSSSAASTTNARQRSHQIIREEDEDFWRQGDASRGCEMDQDVMEDVEEEAQVDASLYSTTSPIQIQFSHTSSSPTFGSSPTTYALRDPFLAQQLQAAEQRSRQPSFFAQIATTQQNTSPFYTAVSQPQQPQPSVSADPQHTTYSSTSMFQTSPSRSVRHPLTIDTGPRFIPVDASRIG